MTIDLDSAQFTLAQAVQIVPGLTTDMVQNWDKRKVLSEETASRTKKNAHLKWTLRHLIIMRILVDAGRFGFKPSIGINIARFIALEADRFTNEHVFGGSQRNGVPQYLIDSDALQRYRRAIVNAVDDGEFVVQIMGTGEIHQNTFRLMTFAGAYLTLEADLIFADTINTAFYVQAGFDPFEEGPFPTDNGE